MSTTSGIKKVKKVMKKTSSGGAEIMTETTTITTSQETSEYGGADRFVCLVSGAVRDKQYCNIL